MGREELQAIKDRNSKRRALRAATKPFMEAGETESEAYKAQRQANADFFMHAFEDAVEDDVDRLITVVESMGK